MKCKISVMREIEVNVESEALAKIAADPTNDAVSSLYDDWIDEAIEDVEKATGIPFGDKNAVETISGVYDIDTGEPLLEW